MRIYAKWAVAGLFLLACVCGWYGWNPREIPSGKALSATSAVADPHAPASPSVVEAEPARQKEWLRAQRRAFQGGRPPSAPSVPEAFSLRLQNVVIDTSSSSAQGWAARGGRPSWSSAPDPLQQKTSRKTLPYLVQFTGPVQESWKLALESAGGLLRGYVPHNAFQVELPDSALDQVTSLPFVQWVGPYLPAYKIEPFVAQIHERQDDPSAPQHLSVSVQTFAPEDAPQVARAIVQRGGLVSGVTEGRQWGLVRAEIPLAAIPQLAALGEVQWIEEFVPPVLLNDFATRGEHMNLTNLWVTHGLTGRGQVVAHADTGLDIGNTNGLHLDFAGRLRVVYALGRPGNWSDPNGHGTHTAGSILGDGTMSTGQFRGVAYEAQLVHQSVMDSGGGLGGLPDDLNVLYYQTYTNDARIHSDSWGSSVYGQYTTDSRNSDLFMWDHPDMLLVFSAGNEGYDGNRNGVVDPDSIGAPATAKNMLTVGAAESDRAPGTGGYTARTYGGAWPWDYPVEPLFSDYMSASADGIHQGISSFSSRGPTDDGRFKPDIVSPGTDIISCRSRQPGAGTGWGAHSNSNYTFMGGTSMSCPLTAGAAALVRQYCVEHAGVTNPSAALLKAILISGARTLTPGQFGTNQYREIPATPRPNNVEGWGQVNLEPTLFPAAPRGLVLFDASAPLATGMTNEYAFYIAHPGRLTVMMAYSDYPATAGSGPKLVNDLDLLVSGPDLVDYYPNGRNSPDRTNNVEGLDVDLMETGMYRVRVSGHNVPAGPQPYALVLLGAAEVLPSIRHAPLENTFVTNEPYEVAAEVFSEALFDTNSVRIFWNITGSTDSFSTGVMSWVSGRTYRGEIPVQSNRTDVYYYIAAGREGLVNVSPAGAPTNLYHFEVTGPLDLDVRGAPADLFTVLPAYGLHTYASGNTVRAWATPEVSAGLGKRVACVGWSGAGSVPAFGATNEFDFVLRAVSSLEWLWRIEYALFQTSSIPGGVSSTTWWPLMGLAQTVEAPNYFSVGVTNYYFAHWFLDGLRQPSEFGAAVNPVEDIYMFAAHWATAEYFPEFLDSNGDGFSDWWQYRYYGSLSTVSNLDEDGDGFINYDEFVDRTNPRDPLSYPVPPVIAHVPLASPQEFPAPWIVSAVITDNCRVASATLHWRRNAGSWQEAAMAATTNPAEYSAQIPPPGQDGDLFAYRIEARDLLGLAATNGPHGFEVHYPILGAAPTGFVTVLQPAHSTSNVFLALTNSGTGPLRWTTDVAAVGLLDTMESGTNGWTHYGQNNLWQISTLRSFSGGKAWYCGNPSTRLYANSMNASLVTPPVVLGFGAQLRFMQWARFEYDEDIHYWDGGIVEISTNGGISFATITPVGGYPYQITDNPASPFAPDTPCLAGTGAWEEVVFDLSAYAAQTVLIRFRFGSDAYVVEEGWYVDDVQITPLSSTNDWLEFTQTNGVVAPGFAALAPLALDTTPLALAETRHAAARVFHNDPTRWSPVIVPVALHNNSRLVEVTFEANGTVTPSGDVLVESGSTGVFLVAALPYYHIASIRTNDSEIALPPRLAQTNILWAAVTSVVGTLHASFAENLTSNGVPEWWLGDYGLTNAAPDEEVMGDQDGDGMLTWQEFYGRTIPTNAQSVTVLMVDAPQGANPQAGQIVLRWYSFTNAAWTYDIVRSSNLLEAFEMHQSAVPGTPPVNTYTTSMENAGQQFYRIQRSP